MISGFQASECRERIGFVDGVFLFSRGEPCRLVHNPRHVAHRSAGKLYRKLVEVLNFFVGTIVRMELRWRILLQRWGSRPLWRDRTGPFEGSPDLARLYDWSSPRRGSRSSMHFRPDEVARSYFLDFVILRHWAAGGRQSIYFFQHDERRCLTFCVIESLSERDASLVDEWLPRDPRFISNIGQPRRRRASPQRGSFPIPAGRTIELHLAFGRRVPRIVHDLR